MFHITCCTNGFYVSQSSDSVFDASASEGHSTVYSTLCHLLVAVSPAFEAWYKQHVEEGDRTEKFSLEEILDSLPTLASNTIPSQHWFASSQDNTLSVELLQHASQLMAGEALPYLSSDVSPAPNWLQEYNLVKDQVDAELQPFYSYSLENEFAAAAVRGARRIVDGRIEQHVCFVEALVAEHTASGLKTYQVDGITFTHIEPSLVNTGARALANYSVLVGEGAERHVGSDQYQHSERVWSSHDPDGSGGLLRSSIPRADARSWRDRGEKLAKEAISRDLSMI